MLNIIQSISKVFSNPNTHKAVKTVTHTFRKFPTKHANKAVDAAFKVGVEVGKKACKVK